FVLLCFFFQAEDGIRDFHVTGVQTCALPISGDTRFTTAASMAAVPEPVMIMTSPWVWKTFLSSAVTCLYNSRNAAPLWLTTGRAAARMTRGGTGVGPG